MTEEQKGPTLDSHCTGVSCPIDRPDNNALLCRRETKRCDIGRCSTSLTYNSLMNKYVELNFILN